MNEQHNNFDETFRDRFGNFQQDPPETIWKNVQTEISGNLGGKSEKDKRKWGGIIFLSSLSLIMLMSGLYLGLRNPGSTPPHLISSWQPVSGERAVVGNEKGQPDLTGEVPNHQNTSLHLKNNFVVTQKTVHNDVNLTPDQGNTADNKNNLDFASDPSLNFIVHNDVEPVDIATDSYQSPSLLDPLVVVSENETHATNQNDNSISSDLQENNNDREPVTDLKTDTTANIPVENQEQVPEHDYGRALNMFVGGKFTPGILYGTGPTKNAFTYGGQIDVGYERKGISIQTGIGVEFQKINNVYRAGYLAYEATGKYEYVTSYTIDTIPFYLNDTVVGFIYRPIFTTTQVEVFDSIAHEKDVNRSSHYTYLNIPLSVGYHYTLKNWKLGLKAGGNMTFLLKEKNDDLVLDLENASVSSVSRLTPERRQFWFSLILLPEVEYYFNDDLGIYVEPWFRYSFRQMVAESEGYGIKPYSWGLNAGVKIHF